jgi:hypothetical protein
LAVSVIIHLRPEMERRLAERAARAGLTLEEYLRELVERAGAEGDAAAPSFEEMTQPLARAVEATGITEDELGGFFEDVLKEVREERRAKRG